MWDTVNTQSAHYSDGCWTTGTGPTVIVILGSCRVLGYVNYFARLNVENKYTICLINLVNFAFNQSGTQVDPTEFTKQFENKPVLMDMIKRCKWFIHEHAENFDFLNTSLVNRNTPDFTGYERGNIYQKGMDPEIDISVPNFNDHLILENDWPAYGSPTPDNYTELGRAEIEKFCNICKLTSFPEFAEYFRDNWTITRFFWKPNHVSAAFTLYIFKLMDEKFLHLGLTDDFWRGARTEDLYQFPNTMVTDRDRKGYSITW